MKKYIEDQINTSDMSVMDLGSTVIEVGES